MQQIPKWLVVMLGGLLIIVLALMAVDKGYGLQQTLANKNPKNTLSVTAEGKVKAVPDLATIDLGVISKGATAAEAQDQSSKQINKIIDFIKKQGVSGDDIATSQFNLYPQQDYSNGKNGDIIGYTATQNITVKVRGVDKSTDKLGKILAGVTGAGANQVNSVGLSFDDPNILQGQAREQAIMKARDKAQALASAAGLKLGRVVNVSEATYGGGPIPYAAGADGIGGGGAVAPNIQPGNQDIVADMTVVFEVR